MNHAMDVLGRTCAIFGMGVGLVILLIATFYGLTFLIGAIVFRKKEVVKRTERMMEPGNL